MRLTLEPLTRLLPTLLEAKGRRDIIYQRLFWGALAGSLSALLLGDSPYLESLELSMLNWRYQVSNQLSSWKKNQEVSPDIAIVSFDDSSQFDLGIARFNDSRSQDILSEALTTIELDGPTLVAIDLDLRGAANPRLVKLLQRHRNVVLSLFGSLEGTSDLPATELLRHAASYGYGELTRESNGQVIRLPVNFQSLEPNAQNNDLAPVKSLTEAVIDVHRRIKGVGPPSGSLVSTADQPVYINFRQIKYPLASFQEVLGTKTATGQFKNRIVIIGSALTSRHNDPQRLKTPLSAAESEVQVQADAIATLLDNEAIFSLSKTISSCLLLVLGASAGAAFSILPVVLRTALGLSVVTLLLLVAQVSFQLLHIAIPVVPPLAVLLSSFTLATVIFLDTDLRRRNRELAEARQDMQVRAEKERQRIAEDLHDETLPALSAVARLADRLSENLGDNPVPGQMREKLDSAVSEMRRVINDLHPSVLETMGFVPALENLLRSLSRESGIDAQFINGQGDEDYNLPSFTKLQLYRIVQEALNNVQKHAAASIVEVKLLHNTQRLRISVIDNGRGFNPARIKKDSHGLVNIKQRAQLIGAQVVWKQPQAYGSGTELIISISLKEESAEERTKS